MPSKLDERGAVKPLVTREIHVFQRGGYDEETEQELGNRKLVFLEWDQELERRFKANKMETFSCVEVLTDKSKPWEQARTALTNLQRPAAQCRNWIELGYKSPELNVEGYVKSINAEINAKVVNVTADTSELKQLIETQAAALDAAVAEIKKMKALQEPKKQPAKTAGGSK